ncbi:MAG: hypothetical protein AAF471_00540 [Myxococcota bacterium]
MRQAKAMLIQQGKQQIIQLPPHVRLVGHEVLVEQVGKRIVLTPMARDNWPESFWRCLGQASGDFTRPAVSPQRRESPFE